jgi:hypothetical protein
MRQFLLLAVCMACAAGAAQAEDRFGPQRAAVANERAALTYDTGAALSWSGKIQPQGPAYSDVLILQPQPLADGLLRNTSASPYARPRTQQPAAPVQAQAQAQATPQAQRPGMAAPATGPIAPAQPRFPQYTPALSAAPAAPATAETATLPTGLFDNAAEPADPTPAPRQRTATGANAPVGSRLYSVHSGYGMTADPIPLAQAGVGQ